jgi:hypothetical protein
LRDDFSVVSVAVDGEASVGEEASVLDSSGAFGTAVGLREGVVVGALGFVVVAAAAADAAGAVDVAAVAAADAVDAVVGVADVVDAAVVGAAAVAASCVGAAVVVATSVAVGVVDAGKLVDVAAAAAAAVAWEGIRAIGVSTDDTEALEEADEKAASFHGDAAAGADVAAAGEPDVVDKSLGATLVEWHSVAGALVDLVAGDETEQEDHFVPPASSTVPPLEAALSDSYSAVACCGLCH